MEEEDSEIIPVFEAVNLSSPIKERYFEKKGLEPDDFKYKLHVSLVFNKGLYWITTIIENLNIPQMAPIIVSELFTELEIQKIKNYIRVTMDMVETREWYILFFSDGKRMYNRHFRELRKSWIQTLPQT